MAYLPPILNLPPEALHRILANVDPQDLGRLLCCRALSSFITSDHLLWKEMYLSNFVRIPSHGYDIPHFKASDVVQEDPRCGGYRQLGNAEPSWAPELKRLVSVRKILESTNVDLKEHNVEAIADAVDRLLKTSQASVSPMTSLNIAFLDDLFRSKQNAQSLLCGSSLFQWAVSRSSGCDPEFNYQDWITTAGTAIKTVSDKQMDLSHVFLNQDEPPRLRSRISTSTSSTLPLAAASGLSSHQQTCAKLHCLFGVPIDHVSKDFTTEARYRLRHNEIPLHPYVRSRVYDLRQHTDGSFWGPFVDDGSSEVDWEKLESIMVILNHNMKHYGSRFFESGDDIPAWSQAFAGANPYSYSSGSYEPSIEAPPPLSWKDPYNVTGTWTRIVCFLDYSEFYDFNFSEDQPAPNQPRVPLDRKEATRFITMKIRVTKIEPPGEEDGQDLPIIHFKGMSSSLRPSWDPNANSKIRGTVRLTSKGEVRWTTMSIVHGEELWMSEGIQVGGVQSARGVLGYWFDKDYDEQGPAGPTAFWKTHDGF